MSLLVRSHLHLKDLLSDPAKLSRPLRYIAFAVVMMIPLFIYYWPFLLGGRCYASSDHHLFFEPFCRFIGDAFRQARLPLWNPFLYLGMPQFALPSPSYLYPPTLLYGWLSYSQGLSAQQILHHCAAAIGGALLAESLGLGFAASALAGMAFAFSGYMFTLSANYSLVAGIAWLPAALYVSRKIRFSQDRAKTSLWIMLLSIFVFLMVSPGRPEIFVPVLSIVLAHAATGIGRHYGLRFGKRVVRKADSEVTDSADKIGNEKPVRVFLCRVLAVLIGICLCMPLILPALEWASTSTRAKGLDPSEVMMWSANWYSFTTMFLAQPFGDLQTLGNSFLPVAADRAAFMPFLPSAYLGTAVLTLAIIGLFHTRSPWLVPVVLLLVFGTTLSLGRYTPLMPWLVQNFSSLSVFRYPVKLLVLPIMALCLLSAFGIHAARNNQVGFKALRSLAILWVVVMLSGLVVVLFGKYLLTVQSVKLGINSEIAIAIGTAVFHGGAIGMTMVAICLLRQRNLLGSYGFIFFTGCLLAMDLLSVPMRYPPLSAPQAFLDEKPVLARMLEKQVGDKEEKNIRLLNLYYDPLSIPQALFTGEPVERTLKYYRYCRDLLVANSNVDFSVNEAYGYEGALTAKYRHVVLGLINDVRNATGEEESSDKDARAINVSIYNERMRRYLAASGVQFVACQICRDGVKQPKLDKNDFDIVDENDTMNLRLYKVKYPKPRLELADRWTWAKSNEEVYRVFEAEHIKETSFDEPVIEKLEKEKTNYPKGFLSKNPPAQSSCHLLIDQPEHISISTDTTHPCMLILRDQFHPGWKVLLDSIPVPVYRANGFTRAVYIPEGAHSVEFNYKPDSLKYGIRIAFAALALLAMLAFLAFAPSAWRFVKWTAGQN